MKKTGLFTPVLVGFSAVFAFLWIFDNTPTPAIALTSAPASGADWDGLNASGPTVISSTGKYRMWYQGRGFSFYNQIGLGYAESTDGFTWEKYTGNPVLGPGDPGEWDDSYRGQVAVIEDGGVYKMWYSGGPSAGAWQTGYATSTDGLAWDIYPNNPVLQGGGPGSWDEQESDGPTVIKDGATYKMWYHGCVPDYSLCSVGYATSSDGVSWTKYAGNPVMEPTTEEWDEPTLGWPRVIKHGTIYEMWYHSNSKIGYATSTDGIHWNKYAGNPVLSDGWDSGGVGISTVILEGSTYKMWLTSGSSVEDTRGIGYAESSDGIHWTQPISNPVITHGEPGMIISASYDRGRDQVEAIAQASTVITITISDTQGVKATISGETDGNGRYRSREHKEDWIPEEPDILPGDTVYASSQACSTTIDPVGEITARANNDTDMVAGTVSAPGLAPESVTVLCTIWAEPDQMALARDVSADGGSYECDFSGRADIVGGLGGEVAYFEPDGDMVSTSFIGPYMEVYYGNSDGVGGVYPIGHTFWITVTNSTGAIKATSVATSTTDGGWWEHGFMPTWAGGDCCDWSPAAPNILPGDWVYYRSDDGYENQVHVGTIYGTVDVDDDSVTGPIYSPWLTKTLEVWCHPQTMWPYIYRDSTADPDGSSPYFCEWQTPISGMDPWDIQADDDVMVHYVEPDGDKVYRTVLASAGAPPNYLYLPAVVR